MKDKCTILENRICQKILKNNSEYSIFNLGKRKIYDRKIQRKIKEEWIKFEKKESNAKNNFTFFSINKLEDYKDDYVQMRKFDCVQAFARTNAFLKHNVWGTNFIPLSSICLIKTADNKFIFGLKENMNKKISGFSGYMLEEDLHKNKEQINIFKYLSRTLEEELTLDKRDIKQIFRIGKVYADSPIDKKGLLNNRAKNNVFLVELNKGSKEIKKEFKKNFQFKDLIFCDETKLNIFLNKKYKNMSIHCIGALFNLYESKKLKSIPVFPKKIYEEKIIFKKKKILITGVGGFIGSQLADYFGKDFDVIGLDLVEPINKRIKFYLGNIEDKKLLTKIFKEKKINFVIHAAAEKSLKNCEKNKKLAYKVNYLSTKNIYNLSKEFNSKFIFISSDIVFNGLKGNYSEKDKTSPINQYGKLKDLCEKFLMKQKDVAICRTALVFGRIPENQREYFKEILKKEELVVQGFLVEHVLSKLKKNLPISLAENEYCNPTGNKTLAKQISAVIRNDASGIIHCCGKSKISKYEFGKKVAKLFNLDSRLIKRIFSNEVIRPKDVTLNTKYSQNKLKISFPEIEEMILEEYNEDFKK